MVDMVSYSRAADAWLCDFLSAAYGGGDRKAWTVVSVMGKMISYG